MKKVVLLVLYSVLLLFIGRSLLFLPKISFLSAPSENTENLESSLKTYLKTRKGSYSIYYKEIDPSSKSPVEFGINPDQVYTGGSLNKVPIVATLYALSKTGKVDLDTTIVLQKEDIQDYGTGSLRYQKPGSAYSLRTLGKLSLKNSDNTAAKLLSTRLGVDVIQKHVDLWGMTQTNMVNNKTSAKDISILFEKIYNGEVASPASTKELLNFLSDTDFEDRIPLYLPKTVTVYHKTGDVVGGVHDSAVVKGSDTVFLLSILSSDIGASEIEAKKTIGEVAKKIYDFNQNNQ